jgi:3-hydroxyisobutyrate dehydrogenase
MAARLRVAGISVVVYDQDAAAASAFASQHDAVAAAALDDVVVPGGALVTMLPDGHAVRSVLGAALGDGTGALAKLGSTGVVIDMSSSEPEGTVALGALLAEHGIAFIDAPVSGGVARARTGELAIFAGGDGVVVDRCRPVLSAMGSSIFHVGPLGSGHAMKALNNLLSAVGLIASAEVLLAGSKFGLDPQVMLDVLNVSSGRNNSTENKFAQFILPRSYDSGFALSLMVKDLQTAIGLARSTRTPSPVGALVTELWACAQSQLPSGCDHTSVVAWLEQLAGARLGPEKATLTNPGKD